jgi:hypothetical protein
MYHDDGTRCRANGPENRSRTTEEQPKNNRIASSDSLDRPPVSNLRAAVRFVPAVRIDTAAARRRPDR